MLDVLPPGLFGLLVVSFLAAFMSVDTHLHWGASLLVHDVYRRFIAPQKDERHHVLMSRLAIVGLAAMGATASFAIDEIRGAWGSHSPSRQESARSTSADGFGGG